MRKIFTSFTFIALCFGTHLNLTAQVEQISVGESYGQQAYYNLTSGEVVEVANEAWDIAFSSSGGQDAGIFINESSSLTGAPLKLFLAPTTEWTDTIADVSIFADSVIIYNPEENWIEGAFNTLRDTASPFDYGWGAYNPMSHIIEGNKIFVIRKRDESFIKLQVQQLTGGAYSFRYAGLDGDNEVSTSVAKNQADDVPLVYFSFETGDTVEMPTDYDLIFQRYTTPLDAGDGTTIQYAVTGVLLGPGTEAVVADGVDPGNVGESDYSDQYSTTPTTIGHEWKSFDINGGGWSIDEDRANFVKTRDGEVYKVVFYDFEGSGTGVTTLEKTLVETISSTQLDIRDLGLSIYPNPATNYITMEGVKEPVQVQLYDLQGRLALTRQISNSSDQIDLLGLNPGLYSLILKGKEFHTSYSLMVTK